MNKFRSDLTSGNENNSEKNDFKNGTNEFDAERMGGPWVCERTNFRPVQISVHDAVLISK